MTALATTKDQASAATVSFLEMKARRIRELSDKMRASLADGAVRLGLEFKQARDKFPETKPERGGLKVRVGWQDWVEKKTSWSMNHANSFIRVAEKFNGDTLAKKTTPEVLRILSQASTPDAAIEEVRARINRGDPPSSREVLKIVKDHRELPSRSQAIKQARDTNKLVAARDGHIYSGASEDEMAAYSERRAAVYAIRRAVDCVAECKFTPKQWIDAAESHWINEFRLANVDAAIKWLNSLKPLLEKKQKVI